MSRIFQLLFLMNCLVAVSLPARLVAAEEGGGDLQETTTSENGDDAHHGDGHHPHIGEPGKEPEPISWRADLAIYTLAIFLLFAFILGKFAWGPIVKGLDAREASIRKDIEDAELARVKAEELLADHQKQLDAVQDEVREIIAEARRDAEHTKNEIVTAAQQEAEATRNRALDEIDRAKEQALHELFNAMSDRVAVATEHVLGRALTDDDRGRLIDDALSQFAETQG